jgi:hypothetical protein
MLVEVGEALGRVVVSAVAAGGRLNASAAMANAAIRIELSMLIPHTRFYLQ